MPKRRRSPKNTGTALEAAVVRVQQLMDPNSRVTRGEFLTDSEGITLPYDVVIRGSFGGRPVLGIMECKDHKVKIGPRAVRAFAMQANALNANVRIMVSARGFTAQGLQTAKKNGVGCRSA